MMLLLGGWQSLSDERNGQYARANSKPHWLIRAHQSWKFDTRWIKKWFSQNHLLPNLLTRKNIRRKFAAKIRCLFQLFFGVAYSFACAREIASPCSTVSCEGVGTWKRHRIRKTAPISRRAGRKDNPEIRKAVRACG